MSLAQLLVFILAISVMAAAEFLNVPTGVEERAAAFAAARIYNDVKGLVLYYRQNSDIWPTNCNNDQNFARYIGTPNNIWGYTVNFSCHTDYVLIKQQVPNELVARYLQANVPFTSLAPSNGGEWQVATNLTADALAKVDVMNSPVVVSNHHPNRSADATTPLRTCSNGVRAATLVSGLGAFCGARYITTNQTDFPKITSLSVSSRESTAHGGSQLEISEHYQDDSLHNPLNDTATAACVPEGQYRFLAIQVCPRAGH